MPRHHLTPSIIQHLQDNYRDLTNEELAQIHKVGKGTIVRWLSILKLARNSLCKHQEKNLAEKIKERSRILRSTWSEEYRLHRWKGPGLPPPD